MALEWPKIDPVWNWRVQTTFLDLNGSELIPKATRRAQNYFYGLFMDKIRYQIQAGSTKTTCKTIQLVKIFQKRFTGFHATFMGLEWLDIYSKHIQWLQNYLYGSSMNRNRFQIESG